MLIGQHILECSNQKRKKRNRSGSKEEREALNQRSNNTLKKALEKGSTTVFGGRVTDRFTGRDNRPHVKN
jgi:hypothetical protein